MPDAWMAAFALTVRLLTAAQKEGLWILWILRQQHLSRSLSVIGRDGPAHRILETGDMHGSRGSATQQVGRTSCEGRAAASHRSASQFHRETIAAGQNENATGSESCRDAGCTNDAGGHSPRLHRVTPCACEMLRSMAPAHAGCIRRAAFTCRTEHVESLGLSGDISCPCCR